MGLRMEIPIVDCYGREGTGCKIEVKNCNASLIHFKFASYLGEVDLYLKKDDLRSLTKVF